MDPAAQHGIHFHSCQATNAAPWCKGSCPQRSSLQKLQCGEHRQHHPISTSLARPSFTLFLCHHDMHPAVGGVWVRVRMGLGLTVASVVVRLQASAWERTAQLDDQQLRVIDALAAVVGHRPFPAHVSKHSRAVGTAVPAAQQAMAVAPAHCNSCCSHGEFSGKCSC